MCGKGEARGFWKGELKVETSTRKSVMLVRKEMVCIKLQTDRTDPTKIQVW